MIVLDLENDADMDTFLTIAVQCDEGIFPKLGLEEILKFDRFK